MIRDRRRLKIQVLFGGDSSERPGSVMSGRTIESALRNAQYENVTRVDIIPHSIKKLISNKPDLAFIALHGGIGEDGTLQGFLDAIGVPYTSSGIAASAISANKFLFNKFVDSLGYKTPKQVVSSNITELSAVTGRYPKVVKPIAQGCSYGVFLVRNLKELKERADFSLKFGGQIVVEDYIPGREFAVGIFKNPKTGLPVVLPIAEVKLKREIYDYETKYPGGESLSQTVIPANLSPHKKKELEEMSKKIFSSLDCKGYVRADVRMNRLGDFYFLENNTCPGMLSATESYIPRMVNANGQSLEGFVDMIVESSLRFSKPKGNVPSEREMVRYLGLKLAEDQG